MRYDICGLGPDHLHDAFDLATEIFVRESTLHVALGVGLSDYRTRLWPSFRSMVEEGLSLIAVDPASQKVAAVLIATRFNTMGHTSGHSPIGAIDALSSQLTAQYSGATPQQYKPTLLVDMAAVDPAARGQGLYVTLRNRAHEIARAQGFSRVIGELSSAHTQKVVLRNMGHRNAAQIDFADFVHDGVRPFASITHPPSLILSEGDL